MEEKTEFGGNWETVVLNIISETEKTQGLHWHEAVEIIFMLNGHMEIECEGRHFMLKAGDIMAVNVFQLHKYMRIQGIGLIFRVDTMRLSDQLGFNSSVYFNCNSSIDEDKSAYEALMDRLIDLARVLLSESSNPHLVLAYKGLVNLLLYELHSNFTGIEAQGNKGKSLALKQFRDILEDIRQNYTKQMTLKEVAERHYMTQPYVSNLFRRYLNKSYTQYIVQLRLEKAEELLRITSETIEIIAQKSGFSSARSFASYFKEAYGRNPAAYRKQCTFPGGGHSLLNKKSDFRLAPAVLLEMLGQYEHKGRFDLSTYNRPDIKIYHDPVVLSEKSAGKLGNHHLLYVDNYSYLLYRIIQDMCRQISPQTGNVSLLIDGVAGGASTCVFQVQGKKLKHVNWGPLDVVLDFLNSIHLCWVFHFDISQIDYWDFGYILDLLLEHLGHYYGSYIGEYGISLYAGDRNFELLCQYYNLTIEKKQAYGMGFSTYLYIQTAESDFLKSLICADLRPDYMIVGFKHFEMDERRIEKFLEGLGRSAWKDTGLIIADICLEPSYPHPICSGRDRNDTDFLRENVQANDTVLRSSYILNVWLEFGRYFEGTACFRLTDYEDFTGKNTKLFYGGNGIFCWDNIRKNSFYIFDFLNHFTGKLLVMERELLIKKSGDHIWILLQNPSMYNELGHNGKNLTDIRYTMDFPSLYAPCIFNLSMTGVNYRKYIAHHFSLSWKCGCAYQYWLENSSLGFANDLEKRTIWGKSSPEIYRKLIIADGTRLNMKIRLQSCEFIYIHLEPVYEA